MRSEAPPATGTCAGCRFWEPDTTAGLGAWAWEALQSWGTCQLGTRAVAQVARLRGTSLWAPTRQVELTAPDHGCDRWEATAGRWWDE